MTPQDTMRLALEQAYERGWIEAACWAQRDDLCADVGSPAYINDRAPHLDAVEAALAQQPKFTNDLVEFVADALTVDKDHARALMRQALSQQGEQPVAWVDMENGVPVERPRLWQDHTHGEVALYAAAPATQPDTWTDDGGWEFPIERQIIQTR